jgi:very-short-patch-repair endonuclease
LENIQTAAQRLDALLTYIEQVVRLDERDAMKLAEHKLPTGQSLVLHQHEFHGLPGVSLDLADDDGPIWLQVERLQRSEPPAPPEDLADWLELSSDPAKAPVVRVRIEDQGDLGARCAAWIEAEWASWAAGERPVRRAIKLYHRLFETAQLAELGGGDRPFELVWGVGLARWKTADAEIDLPLVEQLVEVAIDESAGAAIKVRPRAATANINLRAYDQLGLQGAPLAYSIARRALAGAPPEDGVSPFNRESFEPALRACQAQLDPDGVYLPDQKALDPDQPPPAPADRLTVTDRWVVFARRRSDNFLLADIARLKASVARAQETGSLPGPARALAMGPAAAERTEEWAPLPSSVGATSDLDAQPGSDPRLDLFFPKPFNDEQIEIVRRLEKSDGVVVQGPPGTGKTHTISNIICHAMATGRRVLVVSHGEPALAVLRDQLPEGVRDLAISITATEQAGLRQLEAAVRMLQSVVESVRPAEQARLIQDLEAKVLRLQGQIAAIDLALEQSAVAQLSPALDGLTPAELARRVASASDAFAWFEDRPTQSASEAAPSDEDMARLRAARIALGARLEHVECEAPGLDELPDGPTIAQMHENLLRAKTFEDAAALGSSPPAQIETPAAIDMATTAAVALERLRAIRETASATPWLAALADRIVTRTGDGGVLAALDAFAGDARVCLRERPRFLTMPVEIPETFDAAAAGAYPILVKLARGEKPFGLLSFGERTLRPVIEAIRIEGRPPANASEWALVLDFLAWREQVSGLCVRWKTLSDELGAQPVSAARDLQELMVGLDPVVHEAPAALAALERTLPSLTPGGPTGQTLWADPAAASELGAALRNGAAAAQFGGVRTEVARLAAMFGEGSGKVGKLAIEVLYEALGRGDLDSAQIASIWSKLRAQIEDLHHFRAHLDVVREVTAALECAGAPLWASRLRVEHADSAWDSLVPDDWREAWDWAAASGMLASLDDRARLSALARQRLALEQDVQQMFESVVRERTFYELSRTMTASVRSALLMFAAALRRTGRGTGKGAARNRRDAQLAMAECYSSVPCWIMPTWRVAEQLPGELGSFDLVIMDEASQSDIREAPALLRGKKILVVGDDRQVSPTAAFIESAKIERLEHNYLRDHAHKNLLLPGTSLYELAKVMFPGNLVMLREHFRCVEPIIRFSMNFYPEPLLPLRVPAACERLDPPLIDIYVPDGRRSGDRQNRREAEVIVDEIRAFVNDPALARVEAQDRWRTIGVVSLIGAKQAALINHMILDQLGDDVIRRHKIACGDSATFQGNERDVIFLSMIADPASKQAQTATQFEQRFNVAMSRARDRLVLVRSVEEGELKPNDLKARVIRHFRDPMAGAVAQKGDLEALCESDFEREVFRRLVSAGYHVTPQVGASGFRIDLVVEGASGRRLAVECDGDSGHGPERWAEDMRRQRVLERVGWRFWRCWASSFILDPEGCMADLFETLERMDIQPGEHGRNATVYTLHMRAPVKNTLDAAPASETETPADGAKIGDRLVIQHLDDQQQATITLTQDRDDLANGFVPATSALGAALLGAHEDEEIEVELEGRMRRILVRKADRTVGA